MTILVVLEKKGSDLLWPVHLSEVSYCQACSPGCEDPPASHIFQSEVCCRSFHFVRRVKWQVLMGNPNIKERSERGGSQLSPRFPYIYIYLKHVKGIGVFLSLVINRHGFHWCCLVLFHLPRPSIFSKGLLWRQTNCHHCSDVPETM